MSHFTESQIQALYIAGFVKVTQYGANTYRKKVMFRDLPQDDIEDIMSPDDIILNNEEVVVEISDDDGAISVESNEAYVGPIAASSALAEKILTSCF